MSFCTVCGTETNGNFCPKCGKAVSNNQGAGAQTQPNQSPYTNHQYPYQHYNPYAQNYAYTMSNKGPISAKSRLTALLLCIFLGVFGAHHFYVGRIGYGVLYIFTGGLFGIGILVDLILIATGSYKDQYGFHVDNWNM